MEQTVREKLLVDYAGDKMHLTNCQTGKQQPVEWLVAVLAGSSCPYVQARPSQQKASFFKLPPGYFDKSLLTLCWAIIGLAVLLRRLEPNKDQGRAQQKAFFANK